MSQKQSVTMTREELHANIGGVIITIGADLRNYGHQLNITGDEEVFGCNLVDDIRCPRGSYVIPIEEVIILRDFLNRCIANYTKEPEPELNPVSPVTHLSPESYDALSSIVQLEHRKMEILFDLIGKIYK